MYVIKLKEILYADFQNIYIYKNISKKNPIIMFKMSDNLKEHLLP